MYKSLLSVALSGLLLSQAAAAPLYVPPQSEKEARRAAKVKAKIEKIGTGESARVTIRLRGRRRWFVTGYVKEIGVEDFTVVDRKTGVVSVIPYAQVKGVNPGIAGDVAKAAALGAGILLGTVVLALIGLRGG